MSSQGFSLLDIFATNSDAMGNLDITSQTVLSSSLLPNKLKNSYNWQFKASLTQETSGGVV